MKKKILLVDDEPDILTVFKTILENNDYQVITARDGIGGLKKAVEGKPDLILLDVRMPNKDGLETLRELKQNELTERIPVIMLTVSIGQPSMPEFLEFGAKDYLFKMCDTPTLLQYIKRYIL